MHWSGSGRNHVLRLTPCRGIILCELGPWGTSGGSPPSMPCATREGARVIVRTGRGLETGEVLAPCESPVERGQRRRGHSAGNDGRGPASRSAAGEESRPRFGLCQRRLRDLGVAATLTDVELLFDGRSLYFYFLGEVTPAVEAITQKLAETYDSVAELRKFADTMTAGCGPGCGTEEPPGADAYRASRAARWPALARRTSVRHKYIVHVPTALEGRRTAVSMKLDLLRDWVRVLGDNRAATPSAATAAPPRRSHHFAWPPLSRRGNPRRFDLFPVLFGRFELGCVRSGSGLRVCALDFAGPFKRPPTVCWSSMIFGGSLLVLLGLFVAPLVDRRKKGRPKKREHHRGQPRDGRQQSKELHRFAPSGCVGRSDRINERTRLS